MSRPVDVTDTGSNKPELILNAVESIGRSKHRLAIFKAIYRGKKKMKTVVDLEYVLLNLKPKTRKIRILQEGKKLVIDKIVHQVKDQKSGQTGYEKIPFYSKYYKKIIDLVDNPEKVKKIPTKRNPISGGRIVRIPTSPSVKYQQITIDNIESFRLVRDKPVPKRQLIRFKEEKIKKAFKKIIGESGTFKDWGGEKSDLYSTKLKLIKLGRIPAAIAFKGRGTEGKLTPRKMGKKGDQIERLFQEPAQLFLVVYQGQIDSSLISQMSAFALGKAMSGQRIYFGVIDRDDIDRLIVAYSDFFK